MKFQKKVLDNGLTVLFEKRDVPVTTVMWAVKFGAAFEGENEKGIAHFIEHMCFKGTEKRTVSEIAGSIEGVGGELNAFTHEEITAYHAKVPSDKAAMAIEVLADVFFNPTFPETEVAKEAQVICEEIKMYHDNPRLFVMDKMKEKLYGRPFGMSIAGTEEIVKGLSREDLLSKHRAIYCPENSILCVVGNNDFDEVLELAEKFSVKRELKGELFVSLEKRKASREDIRRAGISQANLVMGFSLDKLRYSNRHSLELFSTILGEGMSSKLFKEVREKRGLVYGVKSEIDIGKNYAYFVIWAGTDSAKVEEVYEICESEFLKMSDLKESELEEAKTKLLGSRAVSSEDSNHVAVDLVFEEMAGDAFSYYDYENKLKGVGLSDIRQIVEEAKFSKLCLVPSEA
ncbi:insulinase family protein [Candidatus Pacearchaeota archaeon]|nr:MAG: insulinase family protein [Candidatus Pacearchaeota archaeon]